MVQNVSVLDLPQGPVRLRRRESRELHRLARDRQPHPDPESRRRAVAWARSPVPSVGRLTAIVGTGALGGAALLGGAHNQDRALIAILGLPLTLIAAALAAGPVRGALIHRLNLSALLDTSAVPAKPLEVGSASTGLGWPRHLPVIVALVVNALAAIVARAYDVTLFCLIVAVLGFIWGRRAAAKVLRLPVRLDETGLSLSGSTVQVPWTRVAAVELVSSVDPYWLGVAWKLRDPTPVSGLVPPELLTRLPTADRGLVLWLDPRDHPPESIVLTSRAYLAAPPAD
jgi:hypothetical protein